METDFTHKLDQYAQLLVKVGLNLQPGQRLLIGSPMFDAFTPLEALPLVRRITEHAYRLGASLVDVLWGDPQLQLTRLAHAGRDTLGLYSHWPVDATAETIEAGGAVLIIFAQDPDLFAGQDQQAVGALQLASAKRSEPLMGYTARNTMNWLVAAASVPGWAARLFPGLPPAEQTTRLWEAIFKICRADQPDPVAAWDHHVRLLGERCAHLNARKYTALHYRASGTDLTVGLPDGHLWLSAAMTSEKGIPFIANLPTEEVFTIAHRDRADGVVSATKPLSYAGALIEGLRLRFRDGRVVEAHADQGQDLLDSLLATDPGAARLGEVALVPHSSPISQSGMLFYNILIDENASNHLALGHAYQFNLEHGALLSEEAFAGRGGNLSTIHVDFMIGSGQMDVDGVTASGAEEPVLRQGEWAF